MRPRRDLDEVAEGLVLARPGGRVEGGRPLRRRQHPARQGVPALERGGAAGARHLTGPEEVLQGVLDQRPVPPPLLALPGEVVREGNLDLAAGQRTASGHLGEHAGDELGMLVGDPAHAAPRVRGRPAHPEVEQRPGRRRHERRLVRPVLDHPPRRDVAGAVEQTTVIRAESGEEGQVLAAHDDVDAVDLHDRHRVDDALQVARAGQQGARAGETLGRQRDAPRGPGRQVHADRRVTHPWGEGAAGVRRPRPRPASAGGASRGCCGRGS